MCFLWLLYCKRFCSREVVEDIVDGCAEEVMSGDDIQCDSFPLFRNYLDDFEDYFCKESRENALLCGAFCRQGGPEFQGICVAERESICVSHSL